MVAQDPTVQPTEVIPPDPPPPRAIPGSPGTTTSPLRVQFLAPLGPLAGHLQRGVHLHRVQALPIRSMVALNKETPLNGTAAFLNPTTGLN